MKNINDSNGSRNRHLPAFSAVPQPNAPTRISVETVFNFTQQQKTVESKKLQ
jgi:hypothetical protein